MGDMISQDEINELLAGMSDDDNGIDYDIIHDFLDDLGTYLGYYITDENLSFNYVSIENASVNDIKQYSASEIVSAIIDLKGLDGKPIILYIKQHDAKNIAAKMNGIDLSEVEDGPLNEIDLDVLKSLVEALATPIGMLINKFSRSIIPQSPSVYDLESSSQITTKVDLDSEGYFNSKYVLNTSDLNDITFRFFFPEELIKALSDRIYEEGHQFLSGKVIEKKGQATPAPQPQQQAATQQPQQQPQMDMQQPQMGMQMGMNPQMGMQQPMFNNGQMYQQPVNMQFNPMMQNVNAQNAEFQQLHYTDVLQQRENIGLIREVPLEVTVEMGRTQKKIKEILEFSPGTIIELDKIAGDSIDILANGKFIAKGEVVVIDENYGIRITEIIGKPELY